MHTDEKFEIALDNMIDVARFLARAFDIHGIQFHTISAYIIKHHPDLQQVESPQDELLRRLQSKFQNAPNHSEKISR